jgi:RHS repeat-associated protein
MSAPDSAHYNAPPAPSSRYGTGGAGPHGVRTADIGGVAHTLGYDGVGNVTSDTAASGNATYAYNARNLVTAITKNGITQTFKYDPDGQRFYKKSTSGDKHTRRDHLGSIDAILDGAGGIVDVLAHDPFGERRADTWASQIPSGALAEILANEDMRTKRGFTDHEQLDEVEIIHMNGRIYDPRLGRFLNADPIVQAPSYSQSYNRYAYTFNSPLSFVDPSGFGAIENLRNLPSSVERWANSGWEGLTDWMHENSPAEPEFGGPLDPSGANTPVPQGGRESQFMGQPAGRHFDSSGAPLDGEFYYELYRPIPGTEFDRLSGQVIHVYELTLGELVDRQSLDPPIPAPLRGLLAAYAALLVADSLVEPKLFVDTYDEYEIWSKGTVSYMVYGNGIPLGPQYVNVERPTGNTFVKPVEALLFARDFFRGGNVPESGWYRREDDSWRRCIPCSRYGN